APLLHKPHPFASSVRFDPSTSIQKKPNAPARQATSVSSRDDSDDDDLDGDTKTADNGDPTDVKRARRNASVSRRRKQEQMSEFDTQVKMAEETVKRVTGVNLLHWT
ncbi:unnamed protein product, partial [Brassica napus]